MSVRRNAPAAYARPSACRAATGATTLLGVAALLVAGLVIWRAASTKPSPHPESPIQPRPQGPDGTLRTQDVGAVAFTEVGRESGIVFVHESGAQGMFYIPEEMGSGGAWIDYDDDGDLDLYLVQGGFIGTANEAYRNRLFRNDGAGRFEDVSAESGADMPGYGMGAYAADYDNDGDIDLYITRLGPNVLLRNNGDGSFSDASESAHVAEPGFGTGAVFFDFDRDGFLDLYVANYLNWSTAIERPYYAPSGVRDYGSPINYHAPAAHHLYHNRGDGTFDDVSAQAGIGRAVGYGLGVIAVDFNDDGWPDLYVANDQVPAFLWVNQKNGTFVDEAAFAGCAFNRDGIAIAGMGVASEDLDRDGDFDLIVTNIHDQTHLALRNGGGFFDDVSLQWGLGGWGVPYTGFGISLFDQDQDGTLELFVANGAVNILLEPQRPGHPYAEPNQFARRDATGKFCDMSPSSGLPFGEIEMSRSVIAGDYDNDGDVDLLITNNRGPAKLLRNEQHTGHHWVSFDVVPNSGNRNALNARIEIVAGGKTWVRQVRPHVGYLSSSDPRVHFGLGSTETIDRVTVTFVGGITETWTDLAVNRLWQLRQAPSK